jgi:hypothetical protein
VERHVTEKPPETRAIPYFPARDTGDQSTSQGEVERAEPQETHADLKTPPHPLQHTCNSPENIEQISLLTYGPADTQSVSRDEDNVVYTPADIYYGARPPWERQRDEPQETYADKWLRTPPHQRKATLILFSDPHAVYQTMSGMVFRASETGEIEVSDEADAKDLLRAGCKPRR